MTDPDVIVVGAGAAGIGAGRALQELGLSFVILEAAGRIGGRAFTDRASLPHGWDQGCHWLHCADVNPLVTWADRLGARYDTRPRVDHFRYWRAGGWVDGAELAAAAAATEAAFDAIYDAAERAEDAPISAVVPDAGQWAAGVRTILQLMASDDPERVSSAGYGDYDDTGVNWPVVSGYGDLVAGIGAGLPVRLNTPVATVEEHPLGVRVETPDGALLARAAIVTVSTAVLASGAIRIGAGLACDMLDRIAEIPCGAYEKVAAALRRPVPGLEGVLFLTVDPGADAPALEIQLAPPAGHMLVGHMAGSLAREMAFEGPAAMRALLTERLCQAFGSDFENEISLVATTGWQADPYVRGGYSYARPGHAETRRAMIGAHTGRIAYAGEAFSLSWQATAHGAYQSGQDVARRLAQEELHAGTG